MTTLTCLSRSIQCVSSPVVEPLTPTLSQCFFGYYTKRQFDPTDRYVLGLQCDVMGRLQQPDDRATVGIVDCRDANRWIPLAETTTWNWQMGCMAEWLPGSSTAIIYNARRNRSAVAVIHDIEHGEQAVLPMPVTEIAPDGASALTVNFGRLWDCRPETGYAGLSDPWRDQPAPADDGIWRVDLVTGRTERIVSHADMIRPPDLEAASTTKFYFTHPLFNPDGTRFMFWYRGADSRGDRPAGYSTVYTAAPDGSDLHRVTLNNSHCCWWDNDHILAWAAPCDGGRHTWLFSDRSDERRRFGDGLLEFNGHASVSPQGRRLITDQAPDREGYRTLVLYDHADRRRTEVARVRSMPGLDGVLRCDLHPRWNRAGSHVCVDSTHHGRRGMYRVRV